ncbi:GroES-like protein [Amniculicola lignicola CBS 123094]|uniref:GroES-like protein n=1 Tax=Amniculicola lignicola CBS 123094 TaxID=1392246 RepID=A0A6A5WC65_9PLEO|nr:GroES-like protein [Amniculicola lignicola CBS 123094]
MSTTEMKAWQFPTLTAPLERNLQLLATGIPKPSLQTPTQILVQVHTASLNPADYKVPELGLLAQSQVALPGIPGMDFCGQVVEVGTGVQDVKVGEMVFGSKAPLAGKGTLAEYVVVEKEQYAAVPQGVSFEECAGVGVAGFTAFGTVGVGLRAGVKGEAEGTEKRVFINGGSGGTGTFGIQIAKILGAHVTTTCSGANVELCKSLGADDVLDYTKVDINAELTQMGKVFDLVVDNIGHSTTLYKASNAFLKPKGKFIQVSVDMGLGGIAQLAKNMLLPRYLGGGKRKFETYMMVVKKEPLEEIAGWMKEGRLRTVVEKVYGFEELPAAVERLKTGRVKGKVLVRVKDVLLASLEQLQTLPAIS